VIVIVAGLIEPAGTGTGDGENLTDQPAGSVEGSTESITLTSVVPSFSTETVAVLSPPACAHSAGPASKVTVTLFGSVGMEVLESGTLMASYTSLPLRSVALY